MAFFTTHSAISRVCCLADVARVTISTAVGSRASHPFLTSGTR
jgi:hypothetical protein